MEIVINIPKEDYIKISNSNPSYADDFNLYYAIRNGTPLPEHHGRLIDADALIFNADYYEPLISKRDFDFAPTIIEADMREVEDGRTG